LLFVAKNHVAIEFQTRQNTQNPQELFVVFVSVTCSACSGSVAPPPVFGQLIITRQHVRQMKKYLMVIASSHLKKTSNFQLVKCRFKCAWKEVSDDTW